MPVISVKKRGKLKELRSQIKNFDNMVKIAGSEMTLQEIENLQSRMDDIDEEVGEYIDRIEDPYGIY